MKHSYDVDSFKDCFEHEYTWLNGFLRNVGRHGNSPAIYDPELDARLTYRQLNGEANRLAHAFLNDGAGQGQVVMYMLFNSLEFALCYVACHKTGAIGCPINFRLSPGEIAIQVDDSQPAVFIYDAEFGDTVAEALKMATHKPRRIVVADRSKSPDDFHEYMVGQTDSNPELPERKHIYDETCRLYTSGTTHKAKAVPMNDINEVLSAHDVIMHFPLNPTDRTMNMTPWFHRGGLHSGGLCPTFYVGGEVIVLREFNPRRCLQLVAREKVTFLIGVPSILALLARGQRTQPVDLSSLRGIVTMGSPFEKSACEDYMKLFTPNIYNGYGTTETFWNTFLRPYNLPEKSGSAGQACTDDDVRVVRVPKDGGHADPADLAAKDGKEVGEVIIRSPAKSAGCYVNNPEMTREKFRHGFHYTGDLATWDENEFVTIVSRKDDMIINAGENIYPTQIEAVFNEHPKVAECAVIGVPDKRHGQTIAAYIVPSDDSLTVDELKTYVHKHPMMPAFRRPRIYNFVKELPHTATGKLMHYKLREQAVADCGRTDKTNNRHE